MGREIVILIYRHGSFQKPLYLLHKIAEVWREVGMAIKIACGPDEKTTGDLAILHVDLTVAPADYVDFIRRFPAHINGGTPDISKRIVSRHLVTPMDGYDGPVIVKTDRNAGGYMESKLALHGLMPPATTCKPKNYAILKSSRLVPQAIWENRDLVVERFLPEMRGRNYCLRTWVFLGDKHTHSLSLSKYPIVKGSRVTHREALGEVPQELQQLRRELKFDYGKFDYAVVEGRVVLYDANRTPSLDAFRRDEYMPRVRLLAEGIKSF
jgi:hypothetical protein